MMGNGCFGLKSIHICSFVSTSLDQRVMGGAASAGKSHLSKSGMSCSLGGQSDLRTLLPPVCPGRGEVNGRDLKGVTENNHGNGGTI